MNDIDKLISDILNESDVYCKNSYPKKRKNIFLKEYTRNDGVYFGKEAMNFLKRCIKETQEYMLQEPIRQNHRWLNAVMDYILQIGDMAPLIKNKNKDDIQDNVWDLLGKLEEN